MGGGPGLVQRLFPNFTLLLEVIRQNYKIGRPSLTFLVSKPQRLCSKFQQPICRDPGMLNEISLMNIVRDLALSSSS